MHRIIKDLALFTAIFGLAALPAAAQARGSGCLKAAKLARTACKLASASDASLEAGKCAGTVADKRDVRECKGDAFGDARDARDECRDQYDARVELCKALDESVYAPELDPNDFVALIDNPFSPFAPGSHWVYENDGAEGLERIEVDVTDETKTILGITTTVVHDRAFLDDELVEDTLDWLAQDVDGNVWYLGELSYTVEDGAIVSLEGSWEAGVDGALPGLWMEADPQVGDIYRQELLLGEAEDFGEVLSLDASETVPAGAFTNCLRTRDGSPLEPDVHENKVFAPGVGAVLEVDLDSGERTELVEYTLP